MHEVVDRLADEGVAGELVAQERVAINAQPASGSEAAGLVQVVKASDDRREREDRGRAADAGHDLLRLRIRAVRVPPKVLLFQHKVIQRLAVRAAEPVAEIVAVTNELRTSG